MSHVLKIIYFSNLLHYSYVKPLLDQMSSKLHNRQNYKRRETIGDLHIASDPDWNWPEYSRVSIKFKWLDVLRKESFMVNIKNESVILLIM